MADDRTPNDIDDAMPVDRRSFLKAGIALVALPPALSACPDEATPAVVADAGDVASDVTSDGGIQDTAATDAVVAPDVDPNPDNAVAVDFDPQAVPLDATVFDRALCAGAVRDTGVIITSFAAAPPSPVRLKLWRDADVAGQVMMVFDEEVVPTEGYIKTTPEGLAPGTQYHYGLFTDDGGGPTGRSDLGRFRTAPRPTESPVLTIGASACTNWNYRPYVALTRTADEDVDLFIQLGDMAYNDGSLTLADFRDNWRLTLQDPGYRDILSSTASLFTWDDHEVTNNDGRFQLPTQTVLDARQAWFEALPVPDDENYTIWTSYRWGATAEVFVMDCRSERQPATRTSDDPIYISKAQMAWLKDGLLNSPCHFKILMNSVPMTQLPSFAPAAEDRWDGYAAQRQELLDHITGNDIRNVWVLSGDFHVGAVGRVMPDGPASRIHEFLCGPGGNSAEGIIGALGPDVIKDAFPPGQLDYFAGTIAATVIRFDPEADTVNVRFIDPTTDNVDFEATLSESG